MNDTQIANDILPKFSEHLDKIGNTKKYHCFYEQWCNTLTAWSLVNLYSVSFFQETSAVKNTLSEYTKTR